MPQIYQTKFNLVGGLKNMQSLDYTFYDESDPFVLLWNTYHNQIPQVGRQWQFSLRWYDGLAIFQRN